jgi:hypothetical protein
VRGKIRAGVTAEEMAAVLRRVKRAVVVRDQAIVRVRMSVVELTVVKVTVMMIENDERRAREERTSRKAPDRPPPPC